MNDLISRELLKTFTPRGVSTEDWDAFVDELPSAQPDLEAAYQEGYTYAESKYRAWIDAQPERKKGEWIIKETAYEDIEAKCSCCGFETLVNQPGNGLHMVSDLHYCPNCGADMKGE